jgi:hypothetical protein
MDSKDAVLQRSIAFRIVQALNMQAKRQKLTALLSASESGSGGYGTLLNQWPLLTKKASAIGGETMNKIAIGFVAFGLVFLAFASSGGTASAQLGGSRFGGAGNNGYCPPGTCAKNGGNFAKDVKFCRAAFCGGKARAKAAK